jgi:hypothetical protein
MSSCTKMSVLRCTPCAEVVGRRHNTRCHRVVNVITFGEQQHVLFFCCLYCYSNDDELFTRNRIDHVLSHVKSEHGVAMEAYVALLAQVSWPTLSAVPRLVAPDAEGSVMATLLALRSTLALH